MKEADLETIRNVIKETVNGKIDRIDSKLDKHITDSNTHREYMNTFALHTQAFIQEMEPVKDALSWVNATQKFLKWSGVPITVAGVGVLWVIRKLF